MPKKIRCAEFPKDTGQLGRYDFAPGKSHPKNSVDLWSLLGFNVGSLLRIPQAQLLSGTERLGSLKERKGDRECWSAGRR
jgi:hypothetical protein